MHNEMPPEMRAKLEELARPSWASTFLSFPILFLTVCMIPVGFIGGALWAGWMMGLHYFKAFATRRALEGMARQFREMGQ